MSPLGKSLQAIDIFFLPFLFLPRCIRVILYQTGIDLYLANEFSFLSDKQTKVDDLE
jgi:hypothetical protein